jgi:hypothetical protein
LISLLAFDGGAGVLRRLVVNEPIDVVPRGESAPELVLVLVDAARQVTGDADVEGPREAGEDVDVESPHWETRVDEFPGLVRSGTTGLVAG